MRNRCPACGKLVPRGHGYKSDQIYCNRSCWQAKPPKLAAVEREFGEPFDDVIRGFAAMGYSKQAVAKILDFNLSYFRAVLTRRELHGCFLPQAQQRPECKGGGKGAPSGRPNTWTQRKYSDEHLLRQVKEASTMRDFRDRLRIDPKTVRIRFGSWRRARRLAGVAA